MTSSRNVQILFSRLYDYCFCMPSRVRRQAFDGQKIVPRADGISVAIAHYNRGGLAHRPLCNLLNHEFIREVVFFDDGSRTEEVTQLEDFVKSLRLGDRIRIIRRVRNRGALYTKLDAVEACRSEWVLILDSDNTVFKSYLNSVAEIREKTNASIYCSPFAFPYFSFRILKGRKLDFNACVQLTKQGVLRRISLINDGNYLVHKQTYLNIANRIKEIPIGAADVMLVNYLWLSHDGALNVLQGGSYHHRIDDSSFWTSTSTYSRDRVMKLFTRLSNGVKWDDQYVSDLLSGQSYTNPQNVFDSSKIIGG